MDDKMTVSEDGIRVTLTSGATVDGFTSDQGGFVWLFTHKGIKTPLALSKEAMEAVVQTYQKLISGAQRNQEHPGESKWVLVREDAQP